MNLVVTGSELQTMDDYSAVDGFMLAAPLVVGKRHVSEKIIKLRKPRL